VSDCAVKGLSPRTVLFITKVAAIYSLGHGLHTFTVVPRLTQPSTFRGTENEYQLAGLVIITMAMVDVDGSFVPNSRLGKFCFGISVVETCYQLSSRKVDAPSMINRTVVDQLS